MQTFFLYSHGVAERRGSIIKDPEIDTSEFATAIRETFEKLQTPREIQGTTKVAQHGNNPDRFDLYFYSGTHSGSYSVGRTYTAPDIAFFERSDFEDYADLQRELQARLDEFARRLVKGELQPARYE